MTGTLAGKVALVTGASQGGTGRAIAVRFAAEGAKVAITARNEAGLAETLAQIKAVGGEGFAMPCDLSDPNGGRTTLVARTEERFGPIDILVNNAMGANLKPVDTFTLEELDAVQQVNVWTPWLLMAELIPAMRERGNGWIVNLTSLGAELTPGPPFGFLARSGAGLYGATKAALNRLTIATAAENEAHGIAVNALTPQISIATEALLASDPSVHFSDGDVDMSFMMEPVETMAEAALALCNSDLGLTGRIAYSLQLLIELDRPVHDITGTKLLEGNQPADLVTQVRKQIAFLENSGGADMRSLNRPSTPLPEVLRTSV